MIEAGRFSYPMYELLIEQNKANSKAMINRIESPSLEEFVACVAILNNSRDAFEEFFS